MIDGLLIAIIKHPRITGAIGVLIAVILLPLAWWLVFWQSPQAAFSGMLANNLATTSVLKIAQAQTQSQSVQQYARLQMGSTNAADWLVIARQSGSSATTESIGTPTAGYIRYTNITVSSQDKTKNLNFAKIENIWGKGDGKTDPTLAHIFDQSVLDISSAPLPPIANLPEQQRQQLLSFMDRNKVYVPNYSTVKRQNLAGRQMYTYDVAVQLAPYVRMMQMFAHDLGLASLDSVDPGQYTSLPPVKVEFAVDTASHQLMGATYPANNFAQRYTDWGLMTPIAIPAKTISTTELQTRIQTISAGG